MLLNPNPCRLARQNERIASATRTVAETEEVGMDITKELASNRAKIESVQSKVSHCACILCLFPKQVGCRLESSVE